MRNYIPNRQILYLFLSSNTILFIGMGLFPFLSVYATQLGASHSMVGVYFAIMYGSNATGPLVVGWLTKHIARRPLFVALSILGIPVLVLMGQVTALWQLVALTAILWFVGGAQFALINVFTSLHSDGKHRGKAFSLMSLSFPLGAIFGGASISALLATQGYATMFVVLAGVWTILPIISIWGLKDKDDSSIRPSSTPDIKHSATPLSAAFYLLLLLALLSTMAINVGRLGTPLSMQTHDFSPETIASTATVAGLITLPIALLIGALSDRKGRRGMLALSYLFTIAAALMLIVASELWSFWLAATLNMIALTTTGALALALATDLLPAQSLNRGLSWIRTAQSSAGVLSFAAGGYIMDTLGATSLYFTAIVLGSVAVLLLGLEPQLHRLSTARIFNHRQAVASVQLQPTVSEC